MLPSNDTVRQEGHPPIRCGESNYVNGDRICRRDAGTGALGCHCQKHWTGAKQRRNGIGGLLAEYFGQLQLLADMII
jgi:hypothetical protein